jgi:hypothetical protein
MPTTPSAMPAVLAADHYPRAPSPGSDRHQSTSNQHEVTSSTKGEPFGAKDEQHADHKGRDATQSIGPACIAGSEAGHLERFQGDDQHEGIVEHEHCNIEQ